MNQLSPSAQKVQGILSSLGSNSKVIEFEQSTRTAQEAADRVGCRLSQIVKSMIFKGQTSEQGILVLTSGSNRVDEKKIAEYLGEPTGRADPEFVRRVTGFAIGGVPPVGHSLPMQTFIDLDLLQYEKVWAAAGTPNAVFEVSSADLIKLTGGKIVRVKPD